MSVMLAQASAELRQEPRSSPRLAPFTATLTTRGGRRIHLRPAAPADAPVLRDFFGQLSAEDRRRRFLAAGVVLGDEQLERMVVRTARDATFLVQDGHAQGAVIAVATLARFDDPARAEIAISVRSDMKGLGVGWTTLNAMMVYARAQGVQNVESLECVDNAATLTLEREMGFAIHACPGDPSLRLAERRLDGSEDQAFGASRGPAAFQ